MTSSRLKYLTPLTAALYLAVTLSGCGKDQSGRDDGDGGSDNTSGGTSSGGSDNASGGTNSASGGTNSASGGDGGEGGDEGATDPEVGNGMIEPGEECDDGNDAPEDGCDQNGQIESGYVCDEMPSVCVEACGDGQLAESVGETCDDGNVEDGDGCSAICGIEGSCAAPVGLVLEEIAADTWQGSFESSTSGGGNQLSAELCGGAEEVGAGPDRVFEYELPYGAQVEVQVTSSANLLVRALDEPCTLGADLICADEGGANQGESLVFEAAAGTHYLVVDGATDSDQGDFSLSITTSRCSPSELKLTRVDTFFGQRRVTLKNVSDECSLHLTDFGLRLQHSSLESKLDVDLPEVIFAPGQERSVVFDAKYAGPEDVVVSGSVSFNHLYANVYLCDGTCLDDGTNIFDAVRSGADGTTPLPATIQFEPALTAINSDALDAANDYVRVAYEGQYPDFLASDWSTAFGFESDRVDADAFRLAVPRNGSPRITYLADPQSLHGDVFQIQGPPPGGDSINHGFDFPTLTTQPSFARFVVLVATDQSFSSGAYFSSSPASDTDGIYTYTNGSDSFTYFNNRSESAVYGLPLLQQRKWVTVEYREIVWASGTPSATTDVYINDVLVKAGASIAIGGLGNVRAAAAYNDSSVIYLAELSMR